MTNIVNIINTQYGDWIKAFEYFEWSFKHCESVYITHNMTNEDMERLEALSVRFERIVDLLIMKLSKSIEIFEGGESTETARNRLQLLEKLGIVKESYVWMEMKSMRNLIVHEYIAMQQQEIFEKIEDYYSQILYTKDKLTKYTNEISK